MITNKKASFELDTMYKEAGLSQSQKTKMLEGLIGAGVGSLTGAGVGALKAKSTSKKKGEDDISAKKRMRRDILIGALTGAGVGGAGSVAANELARNKAKSNVAPGPSLSDIDKSRGEFLNRYEHSRRKNYAMVDGRSHFDNGGKAVRKAEIDMFVGWSPEDSDVAKANAVRSATGRMSRIKNQLENESSAEFISRLRDKKFYASGTPRVEGVTYKNGRPIVGGHFNDEDYKTYLNLSKQRGAAQAEKNLIDNKLFGGFRGISPKDKTGIAASAELAEQVAKNNILADVAAIKNSTRQEYLSNKAKNAKKADRMIYHYSNLADKLEGRR